MIKKLYWSLTVDYIQLELDKILELDRTSSILELDNNIPEIKNQR